MKINIVDIKDIKLSEYNPRKISKTDKKALKESIVKFGLIDPIILNKSKERYNVLIGGHQRLKIWKSLKKKSIPAIYVDLNLNDEKELNIRLNKNSGEFDYDLLKVNFNEENLVDWGFSPFQFADVTFIESDIDEINVNHVHNVQKPTDEAVMLEIPMSPEQKKEIMLTVNAYKENLSISNGAALYEIVTNKISKQ